MPANAPAEPRVLITGGSGQVGSALIDELSATALIYAPTSAELNLCESQSIRNAVRSFRPDWIISAAAYTAVDKAESEPNLAYQVNAEAPRILAEEATVLGVPLLHFSTDYVFDGSKPAPYLEEDPTNPLSVYGKSKLAGEQALQQFGAAFLVFRTSWVYGATGKNFLRTILKTARERDLLRIVDDQRGAPTWSRDLARMTAHVIGEASTKAASQGSSVCQAVGAVRGIYHASAAGETSWFGFASAALKLQQISQPAQHFAALEAIPTAAYPTPARRPLNSRLDCTKLHRIFGWSMSAWDESLAKVLSEMESTKPAT